MDKSLRVLDPIRSAILDAINAAPSDINLKSLSEALGRNHAYLHQFVYKGSPRDLPEALRYRLAQILNINENKLRPIGLKLYTPALETEPDLSSHIEIEQYDHPSQFKSANGKRKNKTANPRSWHVPQFFLGQSRDKKALKWVKLTPNPSGQNVCIIDTNDRSALRAGDFALDMGSDIRISHLEQISPKTDKVHVSSVKDAPYITNNEDLMILGRVVFNGSIYS